ncbi:Shedu immune nuclease family protein [Serinicoccus marinus]|uniref:Shedu immune nuclease family protein n=1 Tax=Serinicoccus marinus TaxID=247333 RepID=UPI0003B43217|nr:Shedu immune nuclease family protein [Serinicoccus marinus]
MPITFADLFREPDEVTYATGRLPSRIYVSSTFNMAFGNDQGQPARYIRKVFDEEVTPDEDDWEWTTEVVYVTPRKQLTLNVARSAGAVRKIKIQKVPTNPDATRLEPVLELDRDQSMRLIELIKALDSIPIEGDNTVKVDDQVLRDLFADPDGINRVYANDPDRFKALIEADADARDVVALQHRREVVETMRTWLNDDAAFELAKQEAGGRPEGAWQRLLEENPWILGLSLGGQLYTSWDEEQLEQVVTGRHIGGVGKRTDALMRTAGIIRSMVFAEIKHHQTDLLASEYRPGCWRPSAELSGALVQVQQTVHLAVQTLSDYLPDHDAEGAMLPSGTFLLRPRSFVIAGSMKQLLGSSGGPIPDKVRSFELFRRNLQEPEVITFDELLARAEWHVQVAEELSNADEVDEDILGFEIDENGVILSD